MNRILYLQVLVIVSTVLTGISCRQKNAPEKTNPLQELKVVKPKQENIPVYAEFTGQVFGKSDVQLLPRVAGQITGIFFTDGQAVEEGKLLYTIDDLPIRIQIDGYRADLAKSITIMTNKKADLGRIKPLAEMKALSAADLDAAIADYEAANSEVTISEARLRDMQIQLGYTRMTAPISGIIGISAVRVGDYVGGPGAGVLNTISLTSDIRVRFPVPETAYLHFLMREKSDSGYGAQMARVPVDLILGDGSVYTFKGRLALADRQVDPNTGSMLIEADFSNPQGILRPGQYVKVRFLTDSILNAIVIPQEAVSQLQDIFQVYVLTDSNRIVPRIVKTGIRVGSGWVIREGIKPGDRVALTGSILINPKQAVRPVEISWSRDSAVSK